MCAMSSNLSAEQKSRQDVGYFAVAAASLLTYDAVLGILEDIQILSIRSPKMPDLIYILSRMLAIGSVSVDVVGSTLSRTSCLQFPLGLMGKCFVATVVPCNSWLFFLRIRAIPNHFRSQATLVISKFNLNATPNGSCETRPEYRGRLMCVSFVALSVFDTATMIAILLGFAQHSPDSSWAARIKSVISTKHMGQLSGLFIRSGLIYYLTTIGLHLSMAVILSSNTIFNPILGPLSIFTGVFHNIMTCRVFRLLKLGVLNHSDSTTLSLSAVGTDTIVFRNTFVSL